jgi:hypothetical protein
MKVAALIGLLAVSCSETGEPPPVIHDARLTFACYPIQFMRPPLGPPRRWCDLAHPEVERTAVVVMDIGPDGTILSAWIPAEPSESMNACLAEALRDWRVEPARNCLGAPLHSQYEMAYEAVFGQSGCLPPPAELASTSRLASAGVSGPNKRMQLTKPAMVPGAGPRSCPQCHRLC